MATPAAKQIKEVEQLFKKANELDGIDPRMAYHVRYYGVLKGVHLQKTNPAECRDMVVSALETLEKNPEFGRMDDSEKYVTNFAIRVFKLANDEDREARWSKTTAPNYLAAAIFIDVIRQFHKEPEAFPNDLAEKQKYAKWRAVEIIKALREGRQPTPAEPPGESNAVGQGQEQQGNVNSPGTPQNQLGAPGGFQFPSTPSAQSPGGQSSAELMFPSTPQSNFSGNKPSMDSMFPSTPSTQYPPPQGTSQLNFPDAPKSQANQQPELMFPSTPQNTHSSQPANSMFPQAPQQHPQSSQSNNNPPPYTYTQQQGHGGGSGYPPQQSHQQQNGYPSHPQGNGYPPQHKSNQGYPPQQQNVDQGYPNPNPSFPSAPSSFPSAPSSFPSTPSQAPTHAPHSQLPQKVMPSAQGAPPGGSVPPLFEASQRVVDNGPVTEQEIQEAYKLTRHASSALQYDDVPTAIAKLEAALCLLKK